MRQPVYPRMLRATDFRCASVSTEQSELKNNRVEQARAVQELLVDAHRVVERRVSGQLIEDQDVAFDVEVELVEQAPHGMVAADADHRDLAAEQGTAHR